MLNRYGVAALRIVAAVVLTTQSAAYGQTDITLWAGTRGGGEFEEMDTGNKLEIDSSDSYGLTVDFKAEDTTWYQLLLSQQSTKLESNTANSAALFDVDINYYHFGGIYEWPKERFSTYLLGTLGATHFKPQSGGASDVTRGSIGFGGGARFNLTKSLGLKLEARGYNTFLDSSGAMFCSGGQCRVIAESSTFWQYELKAGLSYRF